MVAWLVAWLLLSLGVVVGWSLSLSSSEPDGRRSTKEGLEMDVAQLNSCVSALGNGLEPEVLLLSLFVLLLLLLFSAIPQYACFVVCVFVCLFVF